MIKIGKKRKIYEGKSTCPYCKKPLIIDVESETIEPGTKAETEKHASLKKDTQARLPGRPRKEA